MATNFDFRPNMNQPDYSSILEALRRRESLRNPLSVIFESGIQGLSEGRRIGQQKRQNEALNELRQALNPQPIPTEGPVTETGVRPSYTPPVDRNAVMSALARAGAIEQVANQYLKQPDQETWTQYPGALTKDNQPILVSNRGNFKTLNIPGGVQETKAPIDRAMQSQIAKAKVELANNKGIVGSALREINRVQELNKNSLGGIGGASAMTFMSGTGIGTNSDKFKNTADVINTMRSQVVKVLKSSFGAQLSDSEREYLNTVYGALPKMSQVERDIAMSNVKRTLYDKYKTSKRVVEELTGLNSADNIGGSGKLIWNPTTGKVEEK